MMDNPAIRAAEDFVNAGYPVDAAAMLLCELDGSAEEVEVQIAPSRRTAGCGRLPAISASPATSTSGLRSGRAQGGIPGGRAHRRRLLLHGWHHSARPGSARCCDASASLSRQHDLPVANVFHAGDGNLHPLILYDAGKEGQLARTEAFGARILELCVEVGGTITGEHGVGVEKIDQMCVQFRSAELAQFHALKQAFDPARLLNPGKAVPTLSRCAELGGMHVHGGRLPFPELERF